VIGSAHGGYLRRPLINDGLLFIIHHPPPVHRLTAAVTTAAFLSLITPPGNAFHDFCWIPPPAGCCKNRETFSSRPKECHPSRSTLCDFAAFCSNSPLLFPALLRPLQPIHDHRLVNRFVHQQPRHLHHGLHFGSGTARHLQILQANRSGISTCRGTASIRPVLGLAQREWAPPSRFRKHPCRRRCRRSSFLFIQQPPVPAWHLPAGLGKHPLFGLRESGQSPGTSFSSIQPWFSPARWRPGFQGNTLQTIYRLSPQPL
jgi:hypothetical protein